MKKRLFTKEEINEVIDLYCNKKLTFYQLGRMYNTSPLNIKSLLLNNNVVLRTKEEDIALKSSRYNKTCLEKYGVINVSQNQEVKDKKSKTTFEHYGVTSPQKSKIVQNKTKNTCLKKYGVENPSQSNLIKQKKIDKVKSLNPLCINVFQLKSVKTKIKETCLEKFGVENPQQSKIIKEQVKKTNIQRYGNSCCLLNKEIKQKSINTLLEKYGVESYSQTKDFHSKSIKLYKYDDQTFDSLPELALWIYAKDNNLHIERLPIKIEYYFEGKVHYYFPDFRLENKLIEIKNDYLYKKMLIENTVANAKLKCIIANNIEIWLPKQYNFVIKYCINKYGKHFKDQFKMR